MRCQRCGHPADQHGSTGCHIRIVTGWVEAEKRFSGERPCGCTAYAAPYVPKPDCGCPHEVIKESANCVHCGRAVKEIVT